MNREENTCPLGSIPYEVKEGHTLASIATEFYTTEETLLEHNANIDPLNLRIGQLLCITEERPKVPQCPLLNIYVINRGDTIASISQTFGIAIESILSVNQDIDLFNLQIGDIICLPLTPTPYVIVIDTIERQLNLYYQGRFFKSYPIAIGTPKTPTPKGQFYIYNKQVNPGGPFGTRWMGLSKPSYGIHGTNRPDLIGKAVSNGCIRMHNKDVETLFSKLSIYSPVIIL
jgi:L,D-transpeptidase ErfK/SrfK